MSDKKHKILIMIIGIIAAVLLSACGRFDMTELRGAFYKAENEGETISQLDNENKQEDAEQNQDDSNPDIEGETPEEPAPIVDEPAPIVDETAPVISAKRNSEGKRIKLEEDREQLFFGADVTTVITVEEENFDSTRTKVYRCKVISEDLVEKEEIDLDWEKGTDNCYEASVICRLEEGGMATMYVYVETEDSYGNRAEYRSEDYFIDKKTPVIKGEVCNTSPVTKEEGKCFYASQIEVKLNMEETYIDKSQTHVYINNDEVDIREFIEGEGESKKITLYLTEDGEYNIRAVCKDYGGNSSGSFELKGLVVDTKEPSASILVNGNSFSGRSYTGEVDVRTAIEDANILKCQASVRRNTIEAGDEDVTGEYLTGNLLHGSGAIGGFDNASDGIYRINIYVEDKAGHSVSNSMDFVINRQGSKVSHNSYLDELLSEEGKYVRALKDDIVITEINPSGVIGGSQFAITEDGKPMALDDVMTTSSDEINGWKRYIYRIKKEAFNRDGIIKIAFSSTDVGGNFLDEKKAGLSDMGFIVDRKAPEISGISLEDKCLRYNIFDPIGIKEVRLLIDGEDIKILDDEGDITKSFESYYELMEKKDMKIKLMAIDFAGNVSEASMEIAGEKIIDQEIREYNLSQPEDGIIVNNADISGSSFLSSGNGLDLSEISFLGGSENGSGILPIMGVIVGGVALVGSFVAIKKKSL